jgi:hypothetical protein
LLEFVDTINDFIILFSCPQVWNGKGDFRYVSHARPMITDAKDILLKVKNDGKNSHTGKAHANQIFLKY